MRTGYARKDRPARAATPADVETLRAALRGLLGCLPENIVFAAANDCFHEAVQVALDVLSLPTTTHEKEPHP